MLVELGVVEQRCRAVLEVLGGASVTNVARRYGVARQTVHGWLRRYASDGLVGLVDKSSRSVSCTMSTLTCISLTPKAVHNSIEADPVFSQMFFAVEPEPDGDEASRVDKCASSASSAIEKGVKKSRPILAKVGSASFIGLRKLGELAMKGFRSSIGAIKSRFSEHEEATPPVVSPADEEATDEA